MNTKDFKEHLHKKGIKFTQGIFGLNITSPKINGLSHGLFSGFKETKKSSYFYYSPFKKGFQNGTIIQFNFGKK